MRAKQIPEGGDWRWLPNIDIVGGSESGMLLSEKL
jgi:hypothetical protein